MNNEPNEEISESLSITENVVDTITGISIPKPVKNNLIKVVSRLSSALIDFPLAHLEGKTAEIRAEYGERIKLIRTTGDQIALQMKIDPEYALRAAQKFGHRVVREQINLDIISHEGVREVRQQNNPNPKLETEFYGRMTHFSD